MSALDIEKERADFIAAYCAESELTPEELEWNGTGFDDGVVQAYWEGWMMKAKRAAQPAPQPEHETIVREGDTLVCTACGTTEKPAPSGGDGLPPLPWECDEFGYDMEAWLEPLDVHGVREAFKQYVRAAIAAHVKAAGRGGEAKTQGKTAETRMDAGFDGGAELTVKAAGQGKPVAWAVAAERGGIHKLAITRESAERKQAKWLGEWPNNKCRVRPLVFGDEAAAGQGELPAVLFDGCAVYQEVLASGPNPPRTSADNVAEVLDAVVRLMRRNGAAGQGREDARLIPCAYRIGPVVPGAVKIEEAGQIEGPPLWAVRKNGNCLNKQGDWEYEPMPSSRDDDFLARCRFASASEAIAAIAAKEGK